jgi:hypothetical protein
MIKSSLPSTRGSRLEGHVFIFWIILESLWEPNDLVSHGDFEAWDFGALFVLAVHLLVVGVSLFVTGYAGEELKSFRDGLTVATRQCMFLYKKGITSSASRLLQESAFGSCSGTFLPLLIHLMRCAVKGTMSVTSKLESACRSQLPQPPLFGSDAKMMSTPARYGSLDQSLGSGQKSPMKMKI